MFLIIIIFFIELFNRNRFLKSKRNHLITYKHNINPTENIVD